jgi:hypothetical protein
MSCSMQLSPSEREKDGCKGERETDECVLPTFILLLLLPRSSLEAVGLAGDRELMRSRTVSQRRHRTASRNSMTASPQRLDAGSMSPLRGQLGGLLLLGGDSEQDVSSRGKTSRNVNSIERTSASAAVAAAGMTRLMASGSDETKWDDGWNEEAPPWISLEIRDHSNLEARAPGDPTDELQLRMEGERVAMMAPARLSLWDMAAAMEQDTRERDKKDKKVRGLILNLSPAEVSTGPGVNKDMSRALQAKLKGGWEAFLRELAAMEPGSLSEEFSWDELHMEPPLTVLGMSPAEGSELKQTLQLAMGSTLAGRSSKVSLGDLVPHLGKLINIHLAPKKVVQERSIERKASTGGAKKKSVRIEGDPRSEVSFTSMHLAEGLLAAGMSDGRIVVIDAKNGMVKHTFMESDAPRHGGELPPEVGSDKANMPVGGVAIAKGGSVVVSGAEDGSVRIWSLESNECLWLNRNHTGPMRLIDATTYPLFATAASGDDYIPRAWNASAFDESAADRTAFKFEGHTGTINCLAITPGGNRLASGSEDSTIHLFDFLKGGLVAVFRHEQPVNCISVSGGFFATGSDDGSVRVWDISLARERCCIRKHQMSVRQVSLVGNRLVSSSDDGTTSISSTEGRGACKSTLSCNPLQGPGEVGAPVRCQAVIGDYLITKEVGQAPVLRLFNSDLRELKPSYQGPCGFTGGGGESPEKRSKSIPQASLAVAEPPPQQPQAQAGMRGATKSAPSPAPDVAIREVERRVGVADPESPVKRDTGQPDTGRRRELHAGAFGNTPPTQKDAGPSKRDLPSIRTQNGASVAGASRNDLTLSYARALTGYELKASGRQRATPGSGSSPIKRIERVDMRSGFHWTASPSSASHIAQAHAYQSRLPLGPAVSPLEPFE